MLAFDLCITFHFIPSSADMSIIHKGKGTHLMLHLTRIIRSGMQIRNTRIAILICVLVCSCITGCTSTTPVAPYHLSPESQNLRPVEDFIPSPDCPGPTMPDGFPDKNVTVFIQMGLFINASGRVVEMAIEKSTGRREFDVAARDAFKICKFRPGIPDGKFGPRWISLRYVWKTPE
jgi:TonB family protein